MGKYNFKERWDKENSTGRFTLTIGWAFYSLGIFGFVVSYLLMLVTSGSNESNEMFPLLIVSLGIFLIGFGIYNVKLTKMTLRDINELRNDIGETKEHINSD